MQLLVAAGIPGLLAVNPTSASIVTLQKSVLLFDPCQISLCLCLIRTSVISHRVYQENLE